MTHQDKIFRESEGDAWFRRNVSLLDSSAASSDAPLKLIDQYALRPQTVLEIGCSNGWRLEEIRQRTGARVVGVEPSNEAITDGRARYPSITFHRATAAETPDLGQFDLVILNYVLHWVARETLFATLSRIDACVADGGYLIIGDFAPDQPCKTAYQHTRDAEVYTYKTNYPAMFTATSMYREVARLTFRHSPKEFLADVPSSHRGGCSLLRKSSDLYPTVTLS